MRCEVDYSGKKSIHLAGKNHNFSGGSSLGSPKIPGSIKKGNRV